MAFLGKKYQMVSSENFEAFTKVAGVDPSCTEAVEPLKPTVELRRDGDSYVFIVSSSFRNKEIRFKPGQEIDEERDDGAMVKSVYNLDGNKLKLAQTCPNGVVVNFVREFGPDTMKAVLTANDVTCIRMYKAI